MLLPQKPYIPIGTLRAAVTYPETPGSLRTRRRFVDALCAAKLGDFINELDVEGHWPQRLSGGEQQRLAIARAILAKPDWLFLDEATTAMDEPMEAEIYETSCRKHFPATTIISIGHRASLAQFHKRHIDMLPLGTGLFAPTEKALRPAE